MRDLEQDQTGGGGGSILKADILEMAGREELRMCAFGETVIYGHHKPFDGNCELALAALSQMLDSGLLNVYRDEDGLFVGPSDPANIELPRQQEVAHGL